LGDGELRIARDVAEEDRYWPHSMPTTAPSREPLIRLSVIEVAPVPETIADQIGLDDGEPSARRLKFVTDTPTAAPSTMLFAIMAPSKSNSA
jgi:hypothetical protein